MAKAGIAALSDNRDGGLSVVVRMSILEALVAAG
jgi:hypothetical protein